MQHLEEKIYLYLTKKLDSEKIPPLLQFLGLTHKNVKCRVLYRYTNIPHLLAPTPTECVQNVTTFQNMIDSFSTDFQTYLVFVSKFNTDQNTNTPIFIYLELLCVHFHTMAT